MGAHPQTYFSHGSLCRCVRCVFFAFGGGFGKILWGIPSKMDGVYFGRFFPFFLAVAYPCGQCNSHTTVSPVGKRYSVVDAFSYLI